jgi:putative nucleotidyltransferase with HDIG domain
MGAARIVLMGLGPKLDGLRWESDHSLKIGRQGTLDVVLRDFSVERLHAEVKYCGSKWIVRDLANSELFPTRVNGIPLAGGNQDLRLHDTLECGKLTLKVVALDLATRAADTTPARPPEATAEIPMPEGTAPRVQPPSGLLAVRRGMTAALSPKANSGVTLLASHADMQIQAVTQHSWDQALELIALDRKPEQGQAMLTLLRANHHLSNLSNTDDLLKSILADALGALGAQRGAILLSDPKTDQVALKARHAPGLPDTNKGYSKTLVERCYRRGESFLCRDVNADPGLLSAQSVKQGTMASIICALLRTPRKRLGVLHLDRGPLQAPFTENELYLADAVAASVGIGIECAQVVELQRQQFIEMVSSLARAVEMRDQYTGDHTRRVTDYALTLAEELNVSHEEKYQIQVGTPLHDIGKIGIDDAILRKPGKLTPTEFDAMKTHTVKGAAILESIGSLHPMIPIVRNHHERWDGAGYPDRLGGDKIHLTARIVAVADAFDAMTSHRPYRPAMPPQLAFIELLNKSGSHFDPTCVQAFLRARPKIEQMIKTAQASA